MEAFVEVAGKLLGRRISEEAELTALRSRGWPSATRIVGCAAVCDYHAALSGVEQPFRVLVTPCVTVPSYPRPWPSATRIVRCAAVCDYHAALSGVGDPSCDTPYAAI